MSPSQRPETPQENTVIKQLFQGPMQRHPAIPGWGERLLPYLFIVQEACWIDAILIGLATVTSLSEPLLPLWAPFLLMASCYWLFTRQERQRSPNTGTRSTLLWLLIIVLIMVVIWGSIYSSTAFLLNPIWLLLFLNDILLLQSRLLLILVVAACAVYLCWRSLRLTMREVEPTHLLFALRLGPGIFTGVIVLRMMVGVGASGGGALLFLLPLFLTCALMGHALSQALFLRRSHRLGLQGSVAAQEKSLLLETGLVGLVLILVSLLFGALINPSLLADTLSVLAPLGRAYEWFVNVLAYLLVLLVIPIFWLLSFVHLNVHPPTLTPPTHNPIQPGVSREAPAGFLTVVFILKIVVPLLFILLFLGAIWWLIQRRRVVVPRRDEDVHESLWSYELFRIQLKDLLLALWRRILRIRSALVSPKRQETTEEITVPAIRTVRELYQVFLRWVALQGYARRKDETPIELQQRLVGHLPEVESEVNTITNTYVLTRYSEAVPDDNDLETAQRAWQEIRQRGR